MVRRREIVFSIECSKAAESLGGFARLDPALAPIWDGLSRNPYGFETIQTDYSNVSRYVVTKRVRDIPALIWLFNVDDNGNVEIVYVEGFDEY